MWQRRPSNPPVDSAACSLSSHTSAYHLMDGPTNTSSHSCSNWRRSTAITTPVANSTAHRHSTLHSARPAADGVCALHVSVLLGGGEREGRVLSPLVASRHFGFSHGVGRSGDLTAQQPKAIGSSLCQLLTSALAQHALQLAGLTSASDCLLMPVATGMTLSLALLSMLREREAECGELGRQRYVVLSRIDQRTCIKCITAAGLQPSIVQPTVTTHSDALSTDVAAVEARIVELGGADSVLCVLSVTSCFAPRGADDVVGLAVMCERLGLPHLVNNAYGVQSRSVMQAIEQAARRGRVDAVVQSMDKNFLVPVGGALVCQLTPATHNARNTHLVRNVNVSTQSASTSSPPSSSSSPLALRPRLSVVSSMSRLYPGRASSSSVVDLLITLLTLGERGWLSLLARRTLLFDRLRTSLHDLAARHNERVLRTADSNDISLALTVTLPLSAAQSSERCLSLLGSMLYRRGVSGMRVWQPNAVSPFPTLPLDGWGGHGWGVHMHSASSQSGSGSSGDCVRGYVSMACAIGMEQQEVDAVIQKLDDTMVRWKKKMKQPTTPSTAASESATIGYADVHAGA